VGDTLLQHALQQAWGAAQVSGGEVAVRGRPTDGASEAVPRVGVSRDEAEQLLWVGIGQRSYGARVLLAHRPRAVVMATTDYAGVSPANVNVHTSTAVAVMLPPFANRSIPRLSGRDG